MTPSVDSRSTVSHGRNEGKPESSVAAKDIVAVKQPLFKSLLHNDESDAADAPNPDVSDQSSDATHSLSRDSEELLLREPESIKSTEDIEGEKNHGNAVIVEMPEPALVKPDEAERGTAHPDADARPVTVPVVIDSDAVDSAQPEPSLVKSVAETSSRAADIDPLLPKTTVVEVDDADKNPLKLPVTVPEDSVAVRTDQGASRNTTIPVAHSSIVPMPSSSPVTPASDELVAPVVQNTVIPLKEGVKPGSNKERAEPVVSGVLTTPAESMRFRFNQLTLDNMPVVEYRNANQASALTTHQPVEIVTQPVAGSVVTDASVTARVDLAAGSQSTQSRLQPTFIQNTAGQIKMMVSRGIGRAAVQLNPADLGAMHINIDLKSDQINVQISVAQSTTREVMEAALPRLREQLQADGYTQINIDLEDGPMGEQSSDRNGGANPMFDSGVATGTETLESDATQEKTATSIRQNVIDLFA